MNVHSHHQPYSDSLWIFTMNIQSSQTPYICPSWTLKKSCSNIDIFFSLILVYIIYEAAMFVWSFIKITNLWNNVFSRNAANLYPASIFDFENWQYLHNSVRLHDNDSMSYQQPVPTRTKTIITVTILYPGKHHRFRNLPMHLQPFINIKIAVSGS